MTVIHINQLLETKSHSKHQSEGSRGLYSQACLLLRLKAIKTQHTISNTKMMPMMSLFPLLFFYT